MKHTVAVKFDGFHNKAPIYRATLGRTGSDVDPRRASSTQEKVWNEQAQLEDQKAGS